MRSLSLALTGFSIFIFVVFISTKPAFAQENLDATTSDQGNMIQEQSELEESPDLNTQVQNTLSTQLQTTQADTSINTSGLKKELYAFLPYWRINSTTDTYLQYNLISTLAYFAVGLEPNGAISKDNNNYRMWNNSLLTKIFSNSHKAGTKNVITIERFNYQGKNQIAELLNSASNRKRAISSILTLIKSRKNVDGVNIDFEVVNSAQRDQFTTFIKDLRQELNKTNPKASIVIDLLQSEYASKAINFKELSKYVDGFFIMSYTIRNEGSKNAGSRIPYEGWDKVINNYLKVAPANKLIPAVASYNIEWNTVNDQLHAPKTSGKKQAKLKYYRDIYKVDPSLEKLKDSRDKSLWYKYYDCDTNKWVQVYYDDRTTWGQKLDIVNNKGLKGFGIWDVNGDQGYLDLWQAIYDKYADKTQISAPVKKPGFVTPPVFKPKKCTIPTTPKEFPDTILKFNVGLNTIGTVGTTKVITSQSSNKTPKSPVRKLAVEVYSTDNKLAYSTTGNITYNQTTGRFEENVAIPSTASKKFASGNYYIKIKTDGRLKKQIPGIITLTYGKSTTIPSVNLTAGDINGDNRLSILDYNIFISCSIFAKTTAAKAACATNANYKIYSDLNDDSNVDQFDYIYFLQEFSVQNGD